MKTLRERPLQIYLRPDQDKALRQLAAKEHTSLAELVRRGIDRLLAEMPVEDDPAMRIIGLGRSGKKDLSTAHDRYLVQALRKHHR